MLTNTATRERSVTFASRTFTGLRDDLRAALLSDPTTKVSTPGFKPAQMPAFEVLFDVLSGVDSEPMQIVVARLITAAAKAGDVSALMLIDVAAGEHARFHEDIAAEDFE